MANRGQVPGQPEQPERLPGAGRRGLILFFVYFGVFFGFVVLNVIAPDAMQRETIPVGGTERSLGGPDLAVVYGAVLIGAAILLALMDTASKRGAAGE